MVIWHFLRIVLCWTTNSLRWWRYSPLTFSLIICSYAAFHLKCTFMSSRIPLSRCVILSLFLDTWIIDEKRMIREWLSGIQTNKQKLFGMCIKTKAEGAAPVEAAVPLEVADDMFAGHVIGSANEVLAVDALDGCMCSLHTKVLYSVLFKSRLLVMLHTSSNLCYLTD